jgi:hypothetical protein
MRQKSQQDELAQLMQAITFEISAFAHAAKNSVGADSPLSAY